LSTDTAQPDAVTDIEDEIAKILSSRPGIAVIIMCSHPTHDDHRWLERRWLHLSLGCEDVWPVRIPGAVSWLADARYGPTLLQVIRESLMQAAVVEIWHHVGCSDAIEKFKRDNGYELEQTFEPPILRAELRKAFLAIVADLEGFGSTALVTAHFDTNPGRPAVLPVVHKRKLS
jgi:hypothetical protein